MEEPIYIVAAVIISLILSIEALKLHCLTKDGTIASFGVGAFIGVFSSINAFFLLTVFTMAGFAATLKDFDKKLAEGLQEGKLGERTWKNVVGVGLPPCIAVAMDLTGQISQEAFAVLFVSTIAVAGADTIASEIGVRDKKVYMITNFQRVEPGVNGGVSVLGTSASTVAALLIAALGWFVITEKLDLLLLIPFAMGVLGNILDSVFGAVFENKGKMSKYTNNCSTAIIGALVGFGIYLLL